ncbi:Rha family transcriptional regulator [Clostridium cadaveris]|uniref:Rha family transcriptional regulator n=1 Tax=Clostridium cadaveris TaxID=1529 RepID=UPI0015B5CC22|nr:Rha family transcriptional regulator [Clostridium cadaveris]NWK12619.1 Rha family transcriptional regulator [Clostridium cadaveris]
MKELISIKNHEGEMVVTSREIAENFEKDHKNVIRDIENLIGQLKIEHTPKYFIQAEYQHEQNKQTYKEYLLTRDGFTLLAMGFTGSKAIEWKLKYIDAFNKMEQALKNPFKNMSKELKAIFALDDKTQELDERIGKLENNMTIDYAQQEELNTLAKKVVVKTLGGVDAPAYKELNKKAFSQFWKDYKTILQVNSYKNTAVKDFVFARKVMVDWKPSRELELMIKGANSQIRM